MASPRSDLKIEALASHHDLSPFSCGEDSLDRYLKTQADQDTRRKTNGVFILVEAADTSLVLGYYTLCATALRQDDVPVAARKHIPRYPLVSATLLGRMGISARHQGAGLGSVLLADAVKRVYATAETVGSCMLVVDALSERAAAFYEAYGFLRLPDSLRLVLPMRTIQRLLQGR